MHRKAPSLAGPKGHCGVSENRAKEGLREQKTEKAELLRRLTALRLWPRPDGSLGEPRMSRHTILASTHNNCSTEGGPRWPSVAWHTNPGSTHTCGTKWGPGLLREGKRANLSSANNLRGTAERLVSSSLLETKQVHTNPLTHRACLRKWDKCTQAPQHRG